MDGIHDVGGRQGFGLIKVTTEDQPFDSEWEARAFGITKSATATSDYSVDKFRCTREQLPPLEYLTSPYYEQWMRCTMAMLVSSGMVSAQELASGRSKAAAMSDLPPPKTANEAYKATRIAMRFDGPCEGQPEFAVGDSVMAKLNAPKGHTRLPQYVRGRFGRIVACRGAHSIPDDNVQNVKTFEHLYTVAFMLGNLFEEHEGSRDEINVEIWERFLVTGQ